MAAIEERIVDRKLLRLLRAMLRAGVMQEGAITRSDTGTPQGGVISPLLANVYLDRLDRAWRTHGRGTLVRYADDLVVMCHSEDDARDALDALRGVLAALGLRLKQAKTRSCTCAKEARALTSSALSTATCVVAPPFAAPHLPRALALAPGDAARPRPHQRPDASSAPARSGGGDRAGRQPFPARLGGLLPLWKFGPPLAADDDPRDRSARAVYGQTSQTHAPLRMVDRGPPLTRSLRAHQPQRDRRRPAAIASAAPGGRMPAVKGVGEPGAGELHARFDAAAGENQRQSATPRGVRRLPPTPP